MNLANLFRQFHLFCLRFLAAAFIASHATAAPPNVLLIMTDDQGWGDIRSHGNDLIDTPVLDRLATEGARFDRFFVSPVCAPTRASLLTGRYHLRTGTSWVTRGRETMRSEEVTIAEVLKAAGYATGIFGKWHNGEHFPNHPNNQGFDEFVGFCAGHWNNYFDTTLKYNGRPLKTTGWITDVLTDAAIRFIAEHRSQPFFCYVPFNAPHSPFQAPERYFAKYKARGLDDTLACVYAMCEDLDTNIGRLLRQLDDLELTRDTIVIFITDNGPNTDRFNGGMKGRKGSVHEGGVRVPFFIRWPARIKAGQTITNIAAHIDVLPTLIELCGIDSPLRTQPLDGVSLVPLLEGRSWPWRDRLLFTYQSRSGDVEFHPGSVRSQTHRAVFYGKQWELYDLVHDPGQQHNIADQSPELLSQLTAAYANWFASVTRQGFERVPIQVGYTTSPEVRLPAPEAFFDGGVRYFGKSGWANDWLTDWTTEGTIWWDLSFVRPGRYEFALEYATPDGATGGEVELRLGDRQLQKRIRKSTPPRQVPSPDRVPRGEVYELEWQTKRLGSVFVPAGDTRLELRARSNLKDPLADVKSVIVRPLDAD